MSLFRQNDRVLIIAPHCDDEVLGCGGTIKFLTDKGIDITLYILFYFPGLIVFLYMTTGFLQESIIRGERGMDTTWMPYMWPIKSCLWFGIVFLLIQGISELFKSYYAMTKGKWPGDK